MPDAIVGRRRRAGRGSTGRLLVAAGLAAALTVTAGACGGNGGPKSSTRHRQVDQALRQAGFPKATATCATDRMFARLSDSEMRRLVEQARQGLDQVNPQLRQKVIDAIRPCVPDATTTTTVVLPTAPG